MSLLKTAPAAQSNLRSNLRPNLRLYLDTADVSAWKDWLPTGLFYGVTCNPLLLERAGVACELRRLDAIAQQALSLGVQEVHLQA